MMPTNASAFDINIASTTWKSFGTSMKSRCEEAHVGASATRNVGLKTTMAMPDDPISTIEMIAEIEYELAVLKRAIAWRRRLVASDEGGRGIAVLEAIADRLRREEARDG